MRHLKNIWGFIKRTFGHGWNESVVVPPMPNPLPDPGIYMTQKEVRRALTEQLSGKFAKDIKIYLPDTEYYCPSLQYAKKVLAESELDKRLYSATRFDCDDYAICLKAAFAEDAYRNKVRRAPHAFGIVWGYLPGPHALNFVINDDGVVRFVEAQNDKIFLPRKDDKNIWLVLS